MSAVLPARSERRLPCGCVLEIEPLGGRRVAERCEVASGLWADLLEARDAASGTHADRGATKRFDEARSAYRTHMGLEEW